MISSVIDKFNNLENRVVSLEGTVKKQVESIEKNFRLITAKHFQRSNPAYEAESSDGADVQATNSGLESKGSYKTLNIPVGSLTYAFLRYYYLLSLINLTYGPYSTVRNN